MTPALPADLVPLFYRYDPATIDPERDAGLIIRTVLAEGTWDQILWLFRRYGHDRVREVVLADARGLRALPEPTLCLWLLVFGEDPDAYLSPPATGTSAARIARWRPRRRLSSR